MRDYDKAIKLSHNRLLWAERRAWLAMLGCLFCAGTTLALAAFALDQASKVPAAMPLYVELAEDGQLLRVTQLNEAYGSIPTPAVQARLVEWVTRFRRRPADQVLATSDIEWALGLTDEPTRAALSARLVESRPIDEINKGVTIEIEPMSAIEREPGHWELTWRETRRERGRDASTLIYRGLFSISLQALPIDLGRPFGELITYVDYAPMTMTMTMGGG